MRRPNILYIHSHDTGRYVQPYGYGVRTPHLQQLAEEGVLFRQAFCAAPMCSPSRAALLTGQSPHSAGMVGLAHRGFALHDYGQHIVHTLREAGYTSTLVGVQHVARHPEWIGYDRLLAQSSPPGGDPMSEEGFIRDAVTAEDVVAAATGFLANPPEQPFFLSVGFWETHRPFPEPGPGENPGYSRPPAPLVDTPQTRQDMAGFQASARILDDGIGAALDALEASGLADQTLVICTTDHGAPFPGMKCTLTDHGIGVMLIVRGPGGFAGGRIIDAMVSHIDIFPTLCDLLGISQPDWLQGTSLMPLVRDETRAVRDEIHAEINYHAAYEPHRAVRTSRWKYIRRYDERTGPILSNVEDSPSKDVWLANGWRERAPQREQLYDLVFDPNEADNLADDPAFAEVLADMRSRLERWMRATDDPLLHGPIVAPAGASFNDPDSLSPADPVITVE